MLIQVQAKSLVGMSIIYFIFSLAFLVAYLISLLRMSLWLKLHNRQWLGHPPVTLPLNLIGPHAMWSSIPQMFLQPPLSHFIGLFFFHSLKLVLILSLPLKAFFPLESTALMCNHKQQELEEKNNNNAAEMSLPRVICSNWKHRVSVNSPWSH